MQLISALVLSLLTAINSLFGLTKPANLAVVGGEIRLTVAKPVTVSAVALRLTYQSGDKIITVKPNQELTKQNWQYLINKTSPGRIDLAAANLSPAGFKIEKEVVLGSLGSLGSETRFTFDPKQTKLIGKDGKEIPLSFGP